MIGIPLLTNHVSCNRDPTISVGAVYTVAPVAIVLWTIQNLILAIQEVCEVVFSLCLPDLAVSAPFDEDGAIFIFNGKMEKINATPSQVYYFHQINHRSSQYLPCK